METLSKHFEAVYEKAKNYTETSIELFKLNTIDTTADVLSAVVTRMVLILTVSLFSLFVSIAASLYIGQQLGHYYLGFLIVSLFYLILALLIYFFNDALIKAPISNLVIKKLMKTKKNLNQTPDNQWDNPGDNENL